MKVGERYINLIEAALCKIDQEFNRLYWNKHQKTPDSPFSNTGSYYENDTFFVKAYDWANDNEWNFRYKNLTVTWYKYLGRGMSADYNGKFSADFLADMLNNCIDSLRRDFGEM